MRLHPCTVTIVTLDPRTGAPVGWHKIGPSNPVTPVGQLSLFEAPHPWGPWSLFHLEQPWNLEGGHAAYCPDFPAKWQSADGRTLRMVSSASLPFVWAWRSRIVVWMTGLGRPSIAGSHEARCKLWS